MKKFIYLLAGALLCAFLSPPAQLFAKEKSKDRKDRGVNKNYITTDEKTKQDKFRDDVKEKVDKILQGALKSIKAADRAKPEDYDISNSILNQYDEEVEYEYDYTKDYKGDEDDPDLELEDIDSKDLKKFIDDRDKVRNRGWGWFWDANSKKDRDKKHDKWVSRSVIKKLAWKYYRLALQYHEQGKYELAKKYLNIALWFWPTFVEAHTQLGVENLYLNLLKEAEINFKRAIKIDPSFGKAYYGLSILYLKKEPPLVFEAVEYIQYAKELGYSGEQDFFDFVMFVANLPKDSETGAAPGTEPAPAVTPEEQPTELDAKPGYGYGDDAEHSGPPGQEKKDDDWVPPGQKKKDK